MVPSYLIHLLRSGLPQPLPEEFIEQDMCTPVFPNTNHRSREPLTPDKPLPGSWTNCYHVSFETVTLRVPFAYATRDLQTTLPTNDRVRHKTAIREDKSRRSELLKAYQSMNNGPAANPSYAPSPSGGEENRLAASGPRHSNSSRPHTTSLTSVDQQVISKPIPPPISSASYDLAAVQTLADPQDLLREIKLIEKYGDLTLPHV